MFTFFICKVHAVKAVATHLRDMKFERAEKEFEDSLNNSFLAMLHAPTEASYMEAWFKIVNLCPNNTNVQAAVNYFETCWHQHRTHFAFFYLRHMPIYGNFSNNRSEAFNKNVKQLVRKKSRIQDVIQGLFDLEERECVNQERKLCNTTHKLFMPSNIQTGFERQIALIGQKLVPNRIVKEMLSQFTQLPMVLDSEISLDREMMTCPRISGPCSYNQTRKLPCPHLFRCRQLNDECLLEIGMIDEKWHLVAKDPPTVQARSSKHVIKPLHKKVPTQNARYTQAGPVFKNLQQTVSNLPDAQRLDTLNELSNLDDALNKEVSCAFTFTKLTQPVKRKREAFGKFIFKPSNDSRTGNQGLTKKPTWKRVKVTESNNVQDVNIISCQGLNIDCRAFRRRLNLTRTEILVLTDSYSGNDQRLKLSDSHMEAVLKLCRLQFPDKCGFQNTLYCNTGFFPISPGEDFIQPIHSGHDHWVMVTNVGLTAEQKENREVILYDSLIQMQSGSNTNCLIPDAILWQVAQMLRVGNEQGDKNITLHVRPCQQQNNGVDCGVFALANTISLAMGQSAEHIVYSANFRHELLTMLNNGKVAVFNVSMTDGHDSSFRTRTHINRLESRMPIPVMVKKFTIFCFCRMPESYGDIVICDVCNGKFPQKCHLMGRPPVSKTAIADILSGFVCYSCRQSDNYDIYSEKADLDHLDIGQLSGKIEKLEAHKLSRHLPHVLTLRDANIPCTIEQYNIIERIFCRYGFHQLTQKNGELFNAVFNFYSNNNRESGTRVAFDQLTLSQKYHLTLLLTCEITQTECPPLWTASAEQINDGNISLSAALKEYKPWIKTTGKHQKSISKKVVTLCSVERSYHDYIHELSLYTRELNEIITACNESTRVLSIAICKKPTVAAKKSKDNLLAEIKETILSCSGSLQELSNFEATMVN
jgi:hypothetical protein